MIIWSAWGKEESSVIDPDWGRWFVNTQPHSLARIVRVLRTLLYMLLLLGLIPGSHELLENLAHLLHDGHLAHSEAHEVAAEAERCAPDIEHGCTPLSHRCGCCVSLVGLPGLPDPIVLPAPLLPEATRHPHIGAGPPLRTLDPPYHPPIIA